MDNWPKMVIGTILVNPACLLDAKHLQASDFPAPLRPVWRKIEELDRKGALSKGTLLESMREDESLNEIGDEDCRGEAYIQELYTYADENAFPMAVEKVLDAGIKSQLRDRAYILAGEAKNGKPATQIIDEMLDFLYQARRTRGEGTFIGNLLPGFHQKMLNIKEGKIPPGTWHSRIEAVDRIVGYAAESDFIIVAGHGGGGKSSILRAEALGAALEGQFVLTFNGENDPEWYLRYGIAYLSTLGSDGKPAMDDERVIKLDTEILKRPNLMTNRQWDRYMECSEELQSLPWIIQPVSTPKEMEFAARQTHAKYGLSLIQVDQIQNLTMSDFDRLESMTYELRNLAQNLKIPIMAAHQLRKKGKSFGEDDSKVKYKEPQMDDLLYAGEHASKQIWVLYRTDMGIHASLFPGNTYLAKNGERYLYSDEDLGVYTARIKIAKNSSGRTGKTDELAWYRGYNQFLPLAENWRSEMKIDHRPTVKPIAVQKSFNPAPKPAPKLKKEKKYAYN